MLKVLIIHSPGVIQFLRREKVALSGRVTVSGVAGEGRLGTDESTFNRLLTMRSFPQLLRLFQEYEALTSHSVETAIRREFSGKLEQSLLSLGQCACSYSKEY